jgi:hypothetical protein
VEGSDCGFNARYSRSVCLEGLRNLSQGLGQYCVRAGHDSKLTPPEHKSEVLTVIHGGQRDLR